jgi:UDP-N-acetylmuramoyl-L-alanyl-D-glutamate--2,6-diaminopimelate ligase
LYNGACPYLKIIMKIKKLIRGIEDLDIKGSKDLDVLGVSSHSKFVQVNDLFIVKKSQTEFADEALDSGAIALISDMYNPFLKGVCQIIHEDPASIEPQILKNFYAHTESIDKIFVTGTNGKTTCSFMLEHLLRFLGKKVGLLSTILKRIGPIESESTLTTGDLVSNYKDLHLMSRHGCNCAVIEASSHGIAQDRIKGIKASSVLFTNISRDHLDYHSTMQEYIKAKLRLLENLKEDGVLIFDLDCPVLSKIDFKCKSMSFSLNNSDADLFRVNDNTFNFQGCEQNLKLSLLGEHNVKNAMASMLLLLAKGYSFSDFVNAFDEFDLPEGRLDEIKLSNGARAFVDFAHTPEALRATLSALKTYCKGKLSLVFGCGGDRDRGKRALMTKCASSFCDSIIFTSDNPRNETFESILEDMKMGLGDFRAYRVVEDRQDALHCALEALDSGDILCIAGKGHESSQIFATKTYPFSDKNVVQKWAKALDLEHV